MNTKTLLRIVIATCLAQLAWAEDTNLNKAIVSDNGNFSIVAPFHAKEGRVTIFSFTNKDLILPVSTSEYDQYSSRWDVSGDFVYFINVDEDAPKQISFSLIKFSINENREDYSASNSLHSVSNRSQNYRVYLNHRVTIVNNLAAAYVWANLGGTNQPVFYDFSVSRSNGVTAYAQYSGRLFAWDYQGTINWKQIADCPTDIRGPFLAFDVGITNRIIVDSKNDCYSFSEGSLTKVGNFTGTSSNALNHAFVLDKKKNILYSFASFNALTNDIVITHIATFAPSSPERAKYEGMFMTR